MEKIGQKWLELLRNDGKKLAFLSSSVSLEQVIGAILASSEPFFWAEPQLFINESTCCCLEDH